MRIRERLGSQYRELTPSTNGFSLPQGQMPVSRKNHNKGNYLLAVLCIHRRCFAWFAAVKGSWAIDQVRRLSLLEASGVLTSRAKAVLELSQVHAWFVRQFEADLLTPFPFPAIRRVWRKAELSSSTPCQDLPEEVPDRSLWKGEKLSADACEDFSRKSIQLGAQVTAKGCS